MNKQNNIPKEKESKLPEKTVANMISKFQSAGPGKFVTVDELYALRERRKSRQNSSK